MAANSLNREVVRDALAATLTTALVGSGLPVQAVYNHRAGDFGTLNPVVVVSSGGSDRTRPGTFDQTWDTDVLLDIWVFVLYSEFDDAGNVIWSEAESEDRLDLIEKEIMDALIDDYSLGGVCDEVLPAGASQIDDIAIGGKQYRRELITVRAIKAHG